MPMSNKEIALIDEAENNEFYSEPTQNSDLPSDGTVGEKKLLFQGTTDLMLYLDKFGRILKINKAGLKFSGFLKEEVVGKMFWKLPGVFSKRDAPKYLKVFKNTCKGIETKNFTGTLNDRSGKQHIMDFSTYPIMENKKLKYVFVAAKDVTGQKETENRYRLITENTDDLIAVTKFSLNPKYTYISPSHEKIMGYKPEELLGKSCLFFVHPDDKKKLISLLRKYVSVKDKKLFTGKDSDVNAIIEYHAKDKSGNWHYLESTANIMGNELLFVSKDITERKKLEEKLQESEKRFRDIALSSADWIWEIDKNGKYTFASGNVKKILDYSPEELIEASPFDFMPKEGAKKISEIFRKIAAEKKPIVDLENWNLSKSGKRVLLLTNGIPVLNEKGNLLGYRGVDKDITERKKTEENIKGQARLLDLIFEHSLDCIVLLDKDYNFIRVSKTYAKACQRDSSEFLGHNHFEFYPSNFKDEADEAKKGKYIYQKSARPFIFPNHPEWGTTYWDLGLVPILDEKGEIELFLFTLNDVTERKRAEERTKQQNKLNSLRGEIWGLAAQPLSEDELIQQLVDRIGPFFNLEHASFLRIYPKKKKVIVDIQWRKKDSKSGIGEEFPLWFFKRYFGKPYKVISLRNIPSAAKPIVAPIFKKFGVKSTLLIPYGDIDNPQGYIATADRKADKEWSKDEIDIFYEAVGVVSLKTEQKKAEEKAKKHQRKIEQQNIQLKRLDRIKTDFLNVTSHELRTPMAAIKGYIQMLLRQTMGDITPDQKDALNVVLRNTNRLDHLIQDILDISRLESGTMKFIPEKTDISKMIKEVEETMQSPADLKNIKINRELEENLPSLNIDSERIKQVIIHLINNAIKFSPDGSIINIKAKKNVDDILFEIQDFGRGIPKDKQKKIFEKFYQIESGMDREFSGVGLGLTLSQDIVNAHGGRMWIDSTIGRGSTFKFSLPLESVKDSEDKFKEIDVFNFENNK